MAIDPLIARGVTPIDVGQQFNALAQFNLQKRQADNQNALSQYQLGSLQRNDATNQAKMQAEKVYAGTQRVLASPSPKAAAEQLFPDFVRDFEAHHGTGSWQALPDQEVVNLAKGLNDKAGMELGQGPPQETFTTAAPGSTVIGHTPGQAPRIVTTVPDKTNDPTSYKEFERAQKDPAFANWLSATGGGSDSPSAVREYQFYQKLNPAQKAEFMAVKRQNLITQIGGVPNIVQPSIPGGNPQPLSTLPREVGAKAAVAGAEAGAKTASTAQAEAATGLPDALNDITKMRDNVRSLVSDPGFNSIYGLRGAVPNIPGSDAANAAAKRDTLGSQAFSITIQKMRGLGALSDAEGKKVTSAFTRATNPNISAGEAKVAWREVQGYLNKAEIIAKKKAAAPAAANGGWSVEKLP